MIDIQLEVLPSGINRSGYHPLDTHVRTSGDNGAVCASENFDRVACRDDTAGRLFDHDTVSSSPGQAAVAPEGELFTRGKHFFADPDH